MTLGKYIKTPAERKRYQIDFSEWLDTGETITSFSSASLPADASPAIIDAYTIASDGLSVEIYVSGGVLNTSYQITVTAITSGGQTKEGLILFSIRSA